MKTLFVFDYRDYKENGTVGVRPSVRGIIIRDGKIAMIHSRKYDYYTFPGGGIDPNESKEDALIREIREETGLEVIPESIREYGMIIRKEKGAIDDLFIQENYFYLCDASGRLFRQELSGYEIDEELELCWADPGAAAAANRDRPHGELSGQEWAKHLFRRDEMLIGKLKEDGLLGSSARPGTEQAAVPEGKEGNGMEMWDLYDEQGRKTGETWERSRVSEIPEGRYHIVCDILIRHGDGEYLLTQRDPDKEPFPGCLEASAGGSALAGETPEEAARREMKEETGLEAEHMELIGTTRRPKSRSMVYAYLAEVSGNKDAVRLQEGETVDYRWVDLPTLFRMSLEEPVLKIQYQRYKPYFDTLEAQARGSR